MFCVDVAINLPVKNIFKVYTYDVPAEFDYLDAGWRVVVPFARQTVEGFVVRRSALPQDLSIREKLKNVEAVIGDRPWFDAEMLATAQWLSAYYMCSLAEAMRLFVPGKCSIKRQAIRDDKGKLIRYDYEERLKEKTILAYSISEKGREFVREGFPHMRGFKQKNALKILYEFGDYLASTDLIAQGYDYAVMRALLDKGLVVSASKRILRNSYDRFVAPDKSVSLTDEQASAVEKINAAISCDKQETFLLQGITGSGKTEIYLRATAKALEEGKQVLMLVPEIALTAQLVNRFQGWFGKLVAVAHSKLSQNERGDVWYKMRTGNARILIGVRSAVFAPFENLGLIIIDEEHEGSYKQEERPNYHARTVAETRAKSVHCPLILGSATPDITTYYQALKGEYTHLRLTKRPIGNKLPNVEIVDMREELKAKNFSVLSRTLQSKLVQTVAKGEQGIILLNRRGYSTFVMCRDCGESITCEHCAVALVYHSYGEDMRCHYCGNTHPIPKICPKCGSQRIKFFGTGTQKAEAELQALPDVRVLRMDQDSTSTKFAHEEILDEFKSGKYNTLIGTQMVAKGHDIPNVTLVGVLAADSVLNLPDYRASERAFSLLTQAAGRAGRGLKAGEVVLQTYDADNEIIKLAAKQDYDTFAKTEIYNRKTFYYPPFTHMLKLTTLDKKQENAQALAQRVVLYLQNLILEHKLEPMVIAGPFPALVSKVRDLYRYNVLIKATDMEKVKASLMASEFRSQPNLYFDVDPASVI
ncbi:MAG: primosomal protein N' [Phascolarctobacterium sp.]|nr:primosomal protein N' [Phascolarctobacterium sp.]